MHMPPYKFHSCNMNPALQYPATNCCKNYTITKTKMKFTHINYEPLPLVYSLLPV